MAPQARDGSTEVSRCQDAKGALHPTCWRRSSTFTDILELQLLLVASFK